MTLRQREIERKRETERDRERIKQMERETGRLKKCWRENEDYAPDKHRIK